MHIIRGNKITFKVVAIFALLAFASTAFSSGLSVGRIMPKGKVTLYQGSQKIGEFSTEALLPEDTLLSVQGECGVKLSGLYLVAKDRSLFSVKTDPNAHSLTVNNGTIYFALSYKSNILVFKTPEGVITTSQILLNASSDAGLLKGYVSVSDGITKVGVHEGGSMLLSTGDGEPMKINAGQELRLAQASLEGAEEAEGDAAAGATISKSTIALYAAGGAALIFLGAEILDDDDDDDSPSSP